MEVSDQLEGKRLNDLFPINYFHREKIVSIEPLTFENNLYYKYGDVFKVIETGSEFGIKHKSNGIIELKHLYGPTEIQEGHNTYLRYACKNIYKALPSLELNIRSPFVWLNWILCSKDYYHVADILYDLSNEVEEIPDRLFNYIMEICDGIR